MEDTRVFDHNYFTWSCDVCKGSPFENSCGCIQYTEYELQRRLKDHALRKLGRLIMEDVRILDFIRDNREIDDVLWDLEKRGRNLQKAYAEWEPFEDQYYDDDCGF